MILTLPYNIKYLKNRYQLIDDDVERLTKKALPELIKRLSLESLVDQLDIFTDIEFNLELGLSSKINIIKSETEKLVRAEDVIESYINISNNQQEVLVIYNPLFPFLSIKKIKFIYDRVKDGHSNSGLGSYYDSMGLTDLNNVKNIDRGIFSVINKSEFILKKNRLISPVDTVGLSALELVSLRVKDDYELYGLIVNSGLI
jgi:hypothetical protein